MPSSFVLPASTSLATTQVWFALAAAMAITGVGPAPYWRHQLNQQDRGARLLAPGPVRCGTTVSGRSCSASPDCALGLALIEWVLQWPRIPQDWSRSG